MKLYCACLFLIALFGCALCTRPTDQIFFPAFNQTYYIQNERYTFTLLPLFQVPLQLNHHVLYTASKSVVEERTKRALMQNKDAIYDVAAEDYNALAELVGEVPNFVKVNTRKRSLPTRESGFRSIPLAKQATLLYKESTVNFRGQKRSDQIPLGATFCLHIPFLTTCDNSQDLTDVKNALQASMDGFRAEIDSYKNTNNQRANELAKTLDVQRDALVALAQQTSINQGFTSSLASISAVNSAQIAHGDWVIQSQIDYLTRITNSLLKFANALGSTDPRSLAAQPALTKLFQGYVAILDFYKDSSSIPITDERTFNWTEVPLPTTSTSNIRKFNESYISNPGQHMIGFVAVTTMSCSSANKPTCVENQAEGYGPIPGTWQSVSENPNPQAGDSWIFGPFHKDHVGIYPLKSPGTNSTAFLTVVNTQLQFPATRMSQVISVPRVNSVYDKSAKLYCVDFLGYKMVATFDSTPNMLNGIPPGGNTAAPADCNNYYLRNRTPSNGNFTYLLVGYYNGVVVPFYSSCTPSVLKLETNTTTPIGWLANYPEFNLTAPASFTSVPFEMNAQHIISEHCGINLEPQWLGLTYYFPPNNTLTINNIPRGYKLNQFTINPAGELASSLEFVYTQKWIWAYKISRTSTNYIIVDEVNVLDQGTVLFYIEGENIIDESDSFYGEGNNGRDCIHYNSQYEYDLTSCYFQNDHQSYFASQYLSGSVVTTGISRYNNKFQFSVTSLGLDNSTGVVAPHYEFTLIPKSESDFSFSVSPDGVICPRLEVGRSSISGCEYQFSYRGTQNVTFGSTALVFNSNGFSQVVSVGYTGSPTIGVYSSGKLCFLLQCYYGGNAETSTVEVKTPNFEVVSAADLNLRTTVAVIVDHTLNSTINLMNKVQLDVLNSQQNLSKIIEALRQLDFNVTKLVPYEDFTDLRNQVDEMIDNLQPSGSMACAQGVFTSIECFGSNILNAIVVVVVVVVILIILYVVCFKFGLAGRLCGCGK